MAKYDPLAVFLRRQRNRAVELSFREIENLIGAILPKAALRPAWWNATEDDAVQGVQHAAWAASRHSAELIQGADRVRFVPRD